MMATVVHQSDVLSAVACRSRVVFASLMRKRTTDGIHVGVHGDFEEWKAHKQYEDCSTHERQRHMVEKKATTQVAAGAKRLI
jgi:hypothetical protein